MKTGVPRLFRRPIVLAAVGILAVLLTACTGSGGGYLPPNEPAGFTGKATFAFHFSCEDKGGINPPTGQLRIQLTYRDHGSNPIGSPFSIGRPGYFTDAAHDLYRAGATDQREHAGLPGHLPADVTAAGGLPRIVPEA